jgi:hypothetical protein
MTSPIASQNRNAVICKTLMDNPTDVWIEPDVKVREWWTPPDDGYIYVSFQTLVFFPNGNSEIFATLYDEFIKTDRKCRWMFLQLRRLKAKFRCIPDGKFQRLFRLPDEKCAFQEGNDECKLNILKRDKSFISLYWTKPSESIGA